MNKEVKITIQFVSHITISGKQHILGINGWDRLKNDHIKKSMLKYANLLYLEGFNKLEHKPKFNKLEYDINVYNKIGDYDLDNIVNFHSKRFQDFLVKKGVIKDDNVRYIKQFNAKFIEITDNSKPRIEFILREDV